jgi:hypothetical protein
MAKSVKIQTPLRLDQELLSILKEKAAASNRSLNNYIETLLYKQVGRIPNKATIKAIQDARQDKTESIEDLDTWLEKI